MKQRDQKQDLRRMYLIVWFNALRLDRFRCRRLNVRQSLVYSDTSEQLRKISDTQETLHFETLEAFYSLRLSFRRVYIFTYNLFQFCGHTWILTNTIARFLTFGQDALADTFYSVGLVMSLCQVFSILELFHIADGIEKARLLPRFIQVTEKNLLLLLVIMLEEIQSKPVVCVQFMLWNILDLLRYPHELVRLMDTPTVAMVWIRYTLWMPLYILSVATEGVTIYQALLYVEPAAPNSTHFQVPFNLLVCVAVLALGASVTVWQLLKERQHHLEKQNNKLKRK